jgi:hypothetical protein
MDEMREEQKGKMRELEEKQGLRIQTVNDDKRKMIEDVNKTIELEKEKLGNLHRIDIENREI